MDGFRREVMQALKKQGWKISVTGGGHIKATSPKGESVYSANTASDYRSIKKWLRDLRKAGFIWRGRAKKEKAA